MGNIIANNRTALRGMLCAVAACTGLLFSAANTAALEMSDLEFHPPNPAVPYYHFTATLALPEPGAVTVERLEVNGARVRNLLLLGEDEALDPDAPNMKRRMVIATALKSVRPDPTYTRPVLIGRYDWQNGASYSVEVALRIGGDDGTIAEATASAAAPAAGGYWDSTWLHYQSVVVTETAGQDRVNEPVEATLLFYPDTLTAAEREIRVIEFDRARNTHTEIPSQVLDSVLVDAEEAPAYDETGKRLPATYVPTRSAVLMFPASVPAGQSKVYLVFHGNPDAPAPQYPSDLRITGDAPGLTVENSYYRIKLHGLSGMLDEITLKSRPGHTFVHKKETNGAIHWNPDAYAPPRPWVHISDWAPGKHDYEYEETRGPVVFRTTRWGEMPMMPELVCSIEYEFYAGVPWVRMRSSMHARHAMNVQALRNAEVVFAREVFSEAAWWDAAHSRVETRHITSAPDLTEWMMPADTPWLAFFERTNGTGFAGIQLAYANGTLERSLRTQNPYMYITVGPWVYWTRALAYPYGGTNPQQLIRVERGGVFIEEWAYLPFDFDGAEGIFDAVQSWAATVPNPLEVRVGAPIDPRMEVPEEIYIEPGATGWEE